MTPEDNVKTMMFAILCICFIFYLCLGFYSYKKEKRSKTNILFALLCIEASVWAIGYAAMLISPNMDIANIWRIISAAGWCFFNATWVSFAFSFENVDKKNFSLKIQFILYIVSVIFFISTVIYEPSKVVNIETYGFVDNLYTTTFIGSIFNIYVAIAFIMGDVIIYFRMENSKKNRVRRQMKTILSTSLISFCLVLITDFILPTVGIYSFPSGIITVSIGMSGMWYAINKHKMMSISYELVSEYLFESVNEPIFILGEDLLVKSCNGAALNITGYSCINLEQNSLDSIINFRKFKFENVIETGSVVNIEVDVLRANKDNLVCELSATVIYDEYKDILGILILLHDVSERKSIADIQKKYTLRLEESNLKLKNEIAERLLVEEQIRHFIYYDVLTGVFNRKRMLEDVEVLLDDKNEGFAILFIDLDKFKSANDNYGHEAGDTILKTVALRLKDIISSGDTIYRIGGDEFIIILRIIKNIKNVEEIATATLKTLNKAFIYKQNKLFIGASIGISIFPEHGIDGDTIIKNADLAMYEVKRKGGNKYKVYSKKIDK